MDLLTERVVGTTQTTTAVYLKSRRVPPNEFGIYDFAALYNQSGESVTLQWVILRGADVIFVSADATVADGKAVSTTDLPTLMEGEILAARVTGSTHSSTVTMVVSGVYPQLAEVPQSR